MAVIARAVPFPIEQTLADSCWAAVLECWSLVDPRFDRLRQAELIRQWGEGETGGITPELKIPVMSGVYRLIGVGFNAGELGSYIRRHLARSHIFVAYTRGQFMHSVLVYRMGEGASDVSFMDPDGGQYRTRPMRWLDNRGPFVVMRRR